MSKLILVMQSLSSLTKYTISNTEIKLEVIEELIPIPELAEKIVFDLVQKKIHRFYGEVTEVTSFLGEGEWTTSLNDLELIEKRSGDQFCGFPI